MDEIYIETLNHPATCWCIGCARLDMDYVSEEVKKQYPLPPLDT